MTISGVPIENLTSTLLPVCLLALASFYLLWNQKRGRRPFRSAAIAFALLAIDRFSLVLWLIWGFPWRQLAASTGVASSSVLVFHNSFIFFTRMVGLGLLVWAVLADRDRREEAP